MICGLLPLLPVPGHALACQATGLPVQMAQGAALLALLLSLAWTLTRAQTPLHRGGGLLVALSALAVALAAGVPVATPVGGPATGGRIAVVIDLSESLRRAGDARFDAARDLLARRIDAGTPDAADWEGRLFGFAAGRQALGQAMPADRLATATRGLALNPPGAASDLAAGLSEAIDWIAGGPGPGALYLLSDGWFTEADPAPVIARAAGRGLPIHVLAYGAEGAAEGLIAWDLGPEQLVGRPAVARLVTRGPGTVSWRIDGIEGAPVALPGGPGVQPLRLPLEFPARGFSHLSLAHAVDGAPGRGATLFTLVRGPARLLVYGEGAWAEGLPSERFQVTRAAPGDDLSLPDFDIVALDGLAPDVFAPTFPEAALAAAQGGTGLLLVNGPQRGDVTQPQRLADWEETALGPILPVDSDPDYIVEDPPPRVVLIIIDTSGSMAGGGNDTRARQAAHRILEYLRPQDSLTILPFSDGVGAPFRAASLPAARLRAAHAYIDGLVIGGGTNMRTAITAAARLRGTNCDLFVIGDGGYESGQVNTSPICRTTAIGVEGTPLPGFDTRWGQQVPLGRGRQLGNVRFETFEPEPRQEFWRAGPLALRPVDTPGPFAAGGAVGGLALAYARPESEVVLIPDIPPPDPALVFREDPRNPALRSGVFMGDLAQTLPEPTLLAMLDRLAGWSEPDRFDLRLRREPGRLVAQVATAEGWPLPRSLSLSLRRADGRAVPFVLAPGAEPGTYAGSAALDLGATVESAILSLQTGEGRAQLVPIRLPARETGTSRGTAREKDSLGVNSDLLARILAQTGGVDLARTAPGRSPGLARPEPVATWPALAALALALLAAGLWLGGARR
ncbi:vWA domain-containing protein [Mesobacterium pallidum]|uniref:vWA domain-containing protein n=1 Tax=Mesobacterium pallidum TaxID=2872037 RepID=UPI001EE26FD5|nr:VWA domain-containing protein [Mesobacterium pallidum]